MMKIKVNKHLYICVRSKTIWNVIAMLHHLQRANYNEEHFSVSLGELLWTINKEVANPLWNTLMEATGIHDKVTLEYFSYHSMNQNELLEILLGDGNNTNFRLIDYEIFELPVQHDDKEAQRYCNHHEKKLYSD